MASPPAQKLMQPPPPEPSARTAPAVLIVPSVSRSREPPPLPPPLTSIPCVKLAGPWPSRHTVPPAPSRPTPVAVTGTPMVISAGAVSLLMVIAPPQPSGPPSAAIFPLLPGPSVTGPLCASTEIVPPRPPGSPARAALWPTAVIAPVRPALPLTLPPASTLIVPPEPASPNPSAESNAPAGGTPRITSLSAVRSSEPPLNVPPKTLTVFSMSIDPPIAVSEMVPPALPDELEEASARSPSRGLMPKSLMLPDATTAFATRRPAVIMIFPAEVEVVLALAEANLPSETSPSDWMISVPPPAPLTSTGLELAVGTARTSSPPLPSVNVIIPPGVGFVPPVPAALNLPVERIVSLPARISKAFDPPMKLPFAPGCPSVTSRVPKSKVQTPPATGGVTLTVRVIVQAVAVQFAVQEPPQPAITSAAVQTAAASRAGASPTTRSATRSQRLTGILPSCRCGTGRGAPSSCSSSRTGAPRGP